MANKNRASRASGRKKALRDGRACCVNCFRVLKKELREAGATLHPGLCELSYATKVAAKKEVRDTRNYARENPVRKHRRKRVAHNVYRGELPTMITWRLGNVTRLQLIDWRLDNVSYVQLVDLRKVSDILVTEALDRKERRRKKARAAVHTWRKRRVQKRRDALALLQDPQFITESLLRCSESKLFGG